MLLFAHIHVLVLTELQADATNSAPTFASAPPQDVTVGFGTEFEPVSTLPPVGPIQTPKYSSDSATENSRSDPKQFSIASLANDTNGNAVPNSKRHRREVCVHTGETIVADTLPTATCESMRDSGSCVFPAIRDVCSTTCCFTQAPTTSSPTVIPTTSPTKSPNFCPGPGETRSPTPPATARCSVQTNTIKFNDGYGF